MNALWRKLTTKPVWYLERHRNYQKIRERAGTLPPIECSKSGPLLAVLTTGSTFADALWSSWSWLRSIASEVRLRVFVDGATTTYQKALVERLFPGALLRSVSDQLDECPLEGKNLERFSNEYKLGRKACLVLSLQKQGPVLYSDYDVLVFNEPAEIRQAISSLETISLFNQQPLAGSFDDLVLERAKALGLTCPPGFNSGLMWIPRGHLSVDLAEQLLEGWQSDSAHAWFTEQTLLGLLMGEKGAKPLPPDRYVVTMQRQFYWEPDVDYDSIAVRHFIYPVRHVMHMRGQPWLLSRAGSLKR